MTRNHRTQLVLERLGERITPTTAVFSNGMLFIQGDNLGNNINVSADSSGNIDVTERGQAVTITGSTTATTSNVALVVEQAGTGKNNTLATSSSLGSIADSLLGNGSGLVTFSPGNNAPSFAIGSSNSSAVNHFIDNPGGKDVFIGGRGYNLFDWEPGTGTDTYVGAGKKNEVLVVGNNNGTAENDSLQSDGQGGVTYTRNSGVAFQLHTTGIQNSVLEPSTGAGNTVTISSLSGTPTQRVEVDVSSSTVKTLPPRTTRM